MTGPLLPECMQILQRQGLEAVEFPNLQNGGGGVGFVGIYDAATRERRFEVTPGIAPGDLRTLLAVRDIAWQQGYQRGEAAKAAQLREVLGIEA